MAANFPDNDRHGNGHCDQGYCEYSNRHCDQGGQCDQGLSGYGHGILALLPK